jgi:cold shock CspA family protein
LTAQGERVGDRAIGSSLERPGEHALAPAIAPGQQHLPARAAVRRNDLLHRRAGHLALGVAAQDADHRLVARHHQLTDSAGPLVRQREVGSGALNERRVVKDDLFVHHSDIEADGFRTLAEGARVEYSTEAGAKGPKAVGVRPV